MKMIPLTQGQFAKVSDHRFDYLNQWKWSAQWDNHTHSYYAMRADYSSGKHKLVLMHRLIMDTPVNMKCDHRNRDTLDNQDDNLRNCTNSQNVMNGKRRSDNTSGFRGVTASFGKWRARVKKDGVDVFNKTFETAEEAARAYNEEAKKIHGEFARLNEV